MVRPARRGRSEPAEPVLSACAPRGPFRDAGASLADLAPLGGHGCVRIALPRPRRFMRCRPGPRSFTPNHCPPSWSVLRARRSINPGASCSRDAASPSPPAGARRRGGVGMAPHRPRAGSDAPGTRRARAGFLAVVRASGRGGRRGDDRRERTRRVPLPGRAVGSGLDDCAGTARRRRPVGCVALRPPHRELRARVRHGPRVPPRLGYDRLGPGLAHPRARFQRGWPRRLPPLQPPQRRVGRGHDSG